MCYSSTYSHETRRAATEDAIDVTYGSFAPCCCSRTSSCTRGRCTLDIIVEAFDDVSSTGFLEVVRFTAEDVVFEL